MPSACFCQQSEAEALKRQQELAEEQERHDRLRRLKANATERARRDQERKERLEKRQKEEKEEAKKKVGVAFLPQHICSVHLGDVRGCGMPEEGATRGKLCGVNGARAHVASLPHAHPGTLCVISGQPVTGTLERKESKSVSVHVHSIDLHNPPCR